MTHQYNLSVVVHSIKKPSGQWAGVCLTTGRDDHTGHGDPTQFTIMEVEVVYHWPIAA